MSHRRPQDLSRFKKTYSYSKQNPVSTINIDLSTRDLTRFRKTYLSTRNQPVKGLEAVSTSVLTDDFISTETPDELTTEAGDNLIIE